MDGPGRETVLRQCLEEAAARVLRRRVGRRVDLEKIRQVMREILTNEYGLVSFKVREKDSSTITAFFDAHPRFCRVAGDVPQWEPKSG